MKFLVIILLSIALYGNTSDTYAWDSTAAKYMPLQVGNVWVYYGESHQQFYTGSSKIRLKVVGVLDTLEKQYYRLTQVNSIITGNGGGCGLLPLFIRVDSLTMNLCSPGYTCYSNEFIIDSLNSQKNDTAIKCLNTFKMCVDTSSFNIFGSLFASKLFTNERGNSSIRYTKTIGPSNFFWGEAGNWCFTNLTGCVINGTVYGDTSFLVGINQLSTEIPERFELSQNYPNPFNPTTKIKFDISGSSAAQTFLSVYDILGHEIAVLVNKQLQPGSYEADWDASAYPSGVYYYKLESGDFKETKKMVLMK